MCGLVKDVKLKVGLGVGPRRIARNQSKSATRYKISIVGQAKSSY